MAVGRVILKIPIMLIFLAAMRGIASAQVSVNSSAASPDFSRAKVTKAFFRDTFGPGTILFVGISAGVGFEVNRINQGKFEPYTHRFERGLATQTIRNSTTLGLRLALREDDSLRPPTDGHRKFSRALLNVVSFQTPDGSKKEKRKIALPRLIALASTPFLEKQLHPWAIRDTNPVKRVALAFSFETGKSIYLEFGKKSVDSLKKKITAKCFGR